MSTILERVKPGQAGVASQAIHAFLDSVADRQINLHSFMLLRHGLVAAEGYYRPFDRQTLQPVYSVSKSITSAAVGLAVAEGRLSLEDQVIRFFPDKIPAAVHPYTAAMKVKHLLAMCTVHPKSTHTTGEDWVKSFLTTPPSHAPGAVFGYDTTGTHTLCAILQKLTGCSVHEYVQSRLLTPIGISNRLRWDSCAMNINKGGSGISCTTEDMARFGQLYLRKGVWQGRRILPQSWVELSTMRHIDNSHAGIMLDGQKGYGYQFWRCRHGAYCAFGMGGQLIVIMPERDAVFVTTANTLMHKDGHQAILDALWATIYPGLETAASAADAEDDERLRRRLEELTLILPPGNAVSATAPLVSEQRFPLASNPLDFTACEFTFAGSAGSRLRLFTRDDRKELSFGLNEWTVSDEPFMGVRSANAGTWVDEHTCILHIQLLEHLQWYVLTCRFEAGRLAVIQITSAGAHWRRDRTPDYFLNAL